MKKLFLTLAAILTCELANSQLLYQISGNGLKKSSYIIGTCHMIDKTFVDSIPGAKKILGQVEQVCGEVETKHMQNQDTLNAVSRLMMMPGDSTIKSIMTVDQFEKMTSLVKKHFDIDINNPQFAALLKFRPVFIQITLPLLKTMDSQMKTGGELIDSYFQTEAANCNKPTIGLESYLFQMNLISEITSGPWQEQVEDMLEEFDKYDDAQNSLDSLVSAYKKQDIDKIAELMSSAKDSTSTNIEDKLLYKRNENWSKQMCAIMADKTTLFVVGAAHIAGENSVLDLLAKQGYKIKPVTK